MVRQFDVKQASTSSINRNVETHGRLAVLVLPLCLVHSNCTLFGKPYLICAENSWVKSNSPNKATWRVPNDIIVSSPDLRDVGEW